MSVFPRLLNIVKCKGGGKRGHIVADTLITMMFLGWANEWDTKHLFCVHAAQTGKHLLWKQNVSDKNQKHFFLKFVSATNVARTGNLETFVISTTMCSQLCVLVCHRLKSEQSSREIKVMFIFFKLSAETLSFTAGASSPSMGHFSFLNHFLYPPFYGVIKC